MTDREKLIELLVNSPGLCTLSGKEEEFAENADWLIANGVTLATDNHVGDKVYALYSVEEYKTRFGNKRKRNWQIDTRKNLMMQKKYGKIEIREKQCTKTDAHRIGITVFVTREEAERAIADG